MLPLFRIRISWVCNGSRKRKKHPQKKGKNKKPENSHFKSVFTKKLSTGYPGYGFTKKDGSKLSINWPRSFSTKKLGSGYQGCEFTKKAGSGSN
jgi:hypothetical protein